MRREDSIGADKPLRLVEEALLDQPRALLGRDLDVARREQEHLVGDPLHAAVERVGEARGEVDQALGEVGVRALEVEDDRDRVLELVRDLLGVVEALGDDQVDLDVPAVAAVADRAQHARLARAARLVGEDVVDLVAPAPLQPAHVRAGRGSGPRARPPAPARASARSAGPPPRRGRNRPACGAMCREAP